MKKLKIGDEVIVISGRDKGKTGKILKFLDYVHRKTNNVLRRVRVVVQGVNMVKKHEKGNPNMQKPGGIKDIEAPIQVSNLRIVNQLTGKADKIFIKVLEDGRKVRCYKSNGEVID